MTLVFAAGISVVLLPIALGASTLSSYISSKHSLFFTAAGGFMIFLGLWSLWGHSMFPQIRLPVNLKRSDMPSVFTLGVFSGVASSCCAPVLAGIVVLTTLSASIAGSIFVGLAYVFGMVFPLLVLALVGDRKGSIVSKFLQGRIIHIKLRNDRKFEIHSSKLIAGLMFIVMGTITIILGVTNTMLSTPGSDILGVYQTTIEQDITNALLSPYIIAALTASVLLVLAALVYLFVKRKKNQKSQDSYP